MSENNNSQSNLETSELPYFPGEKELTTLELTSLDNELQALGRGDLADSLVRTEVSATNFKVVVNYEILPECLRIAGHIEAAEAWEKEISLFPNSNSNKPDIPLLQSLKSQLGDYDNENFHKAIDRWLDGRNALALLPKILEILGYKLAATLWENVIFKHKENDFYPKKYGNPVAPDYLKKLRSVLRTYGYVYADHHKLVSDWDSEGGNFLEDDYGKLYEILNAIGFQDAANAWEQYIFAAANKSINEGRESVAASAVSAAAVRIHTAERPDAGIFNFEDEIAAAEYRAAADVQAVVVADVQAVIDTELSHGEAADDHGFQRRGTKTRLLGDPEEKPGILKKLGKFFRGEN